MSTTSNKTSGSLEQEYYGSMAHYYDAAYENDARLTDIPFYVDLARAVNGKTLEVACGTGRILLPIARAGVEIDGLDFTPEFLSILRDKIAREPDEIKKRVSLYQGDMRNFSLGCTYDLITIPFRPLQHLLTAEDQIATFKCVNSHLRLGGKLAFNVFYPNYTLLDEIAVEKFELEWKDSRDPSLVVKRFFTRKSKDRLNQFFEGEFIFRAYRDDKLLKEERSSLRMSYNTYPHLLLLMKTCGFRVLEEYGSFQKEPINICKEMIFVAEKIA